MQKGVCHQRGALRRFDQRLECIAALLVGVLFFVCPPAGANPAGSSPSSSVARVEKAAVGCPGGTEDRRPDHVVSSVEELRQLLATAGGNGKDDVILVVEGNYSVSSPLQYDDRGSLEKIHIIGCGTDNTIFDGLSRSRVFNFVKNGPIQRDDIHVGPHPTLVMEALSIKNGRCSTGLGCITNLSGENGGGVRAERYNTRLVNVLFQDNHDDIFGGAIAGVADFHGINLQFVGNTSGRSGAAIDACGSLTLIDSEFLDNRGLSSAFSSHVISRGICLDGDYSVKDIVIEGSKFSRNSGAIYALNGTSQAGLATIRNSIFADSKTTQFGTVALRIGHVRILNSQFLRNVTGAGPGEEKDCDWGFTCKNGAALFIDNFTAGAGLLEVDHSSFVENVSEGYGGAIESGGGFNCEADISGRNNFTPCDAAQFPAERSALTAKITNSTFLNNRARYGAAIAIGRVRLASSLQSGNVVISNTLIAGVGQTSPIRSLVLVGGKLTMINSIVRQTGGASLDYVMQAKDGLRVLNSTIDTRSTAFQFSGAASLTNVAFANDQSIAVQGSDGLVVENSRVLASNLISSQPSLDRLVDTPARFRNADQGDYILRPDSPLLDAGRQAADMPDYDFSGASRWFGGPPDIGALEFGATQDHSQSRILFGLPALPDARFSATLVAKPISVLGARRPDAQPESAFDSLSDGILWATVQVPEVPAGSSRQFRVLATIDSESADRLALFVGEDLDLDGPDESELRCQANATQTAQNCEFLITRQAGSPATVFWAMAQNLSLPDIARPGPDVIKLKIAAVPFSAASGDLIVTGPGRADSSEEFPVHIAWNDSHWLPGEERIGYMLVHSSAGNLAYFEPIWLTKQRRAAAPGLLASGVPENIWLEPGQSHEQLAFDVPIYASSVRFDLMPGSEASDLPQGASSNVRLEAHYVGSAVGPVVGWAPSGEATVVSALPGQMQSITLDSSDLDSRFGRWYVKAVNTGSTAASIRVIANAGEQAQPTPLRKGSYYNPLRPGHGIFMYPAGNQWVLIWYTYLDDGTPTWYYAQGSPPGKDGIFNAALYRSAWNGTSNQLTHIGRMMLTPGHSGALTMAYQFDGRAGSESMYPFLSGCPLVNGASLDASAHWFEPAMPGYGYSVQLSPNYEFHAFFGYDSLGIARFLVAERGGAFVGLDGSLSLQQLQGFSPLAAHVLPVRSTVGTLDRRFNASGVEFMGVTASFVGRVSGDWSRSANVAALTERQSCLQ